MIGKLAALILLSSATLIQTAEVLHQLPVTVTDAGDYVTLICPVSDRDGSFFHWFKQPLGFMPQKVCAGILGTITVTEPFKESRFTSVNGENQNVLTIRNVSKEDEAVYFCQTGTAYAQTVANGTFLAVREHNQQEQVYVKQSLKTGPGDSAMLQCSLLSNNKDEVQCLDEQSVYWFRAGSLGFNPVVLYRHRNKSDEQEARSCSYSLSKTIQDSSDAGTYYCAVVTCGRILFGEGTNVEKRPELDPVVLVLGVLLACCVTVIGGFIVCGRSRHGCDHCKAGERSASTQNGHNGSTSHGSSDLGNAAEAVNYAALSFSTKTAQRMKVKEPLSQQSLYSSVEYRQVDQCRQHQPAYEP
ncbi:uncharacterized protein LOC114864886 isoform X1 [Betta splendens]|uniref:Uncharacterized protein LOC114864886 isoform X1 n=1 Tax=Betta splendens TaxID=158456 RepID=A0A9W2Y3N1_BETSP|nr:uncharacterized protein LOC114864886 isoform X1 [Betta splendens]